MYEVRGRSSKMTHRYTCQQRRRVRVFEAGFWGTGLSGAFLLYVTNSAPPTSVPISFADHHLAHTRTTIITISPPPPSANTTLSRTERWKKREKSERDSQRRVERRPFFGTDTFCILGRVALWRELELIIERKWEEEWKEYVEDCAEGGSDWGVTVAEALRVWFRCSPDFGARTWDQSWRIWQGRDGRVRCTDLGRWCVDARACTGSIRGILERGGVRERREVWKWFSWRRYESQPRRSARIVEESANEAA
jgi:hypothetical protein